MKIFNTIMNEIISHDKITLFFHANPDLDALSSAFGLKFFIEKNFKNKEVIVCDYDEVREDVFLETFREFETNKTTDKFLKSSLGIIVDTANEERVYSKKNRLCKKTIRIDHHLQVEEFCDIEWIQPQTSSATEMVVNLIKFWGLEVDENILNTLYYGILTDTNRFMYSNVNSETFLTISWMLKMGLNKDKVHNDLYTKSFKESVLNNKIFKKIKITKKGVGYILLDKKDNKKYKLKKFGDKVNLMAGYKEIKIWTILYFDEDSQFWKGSLRSREYDINSVAVKFNGGGHKLASGYKLDDKKDFKKVIKELERLI